MLYVGNSKSDSISVIDGSTNIMVTTIEVDKDPRRIAVNPDTNMVYVMSGAANSISVIDGSSNSVVATIPVDFGIGNPYEIAVNPNTNMVYVTNYGSDKVFVIEGYQTDQQEFISLYVVIAVAALGAGGAAASRWLRKRKMVA